MKGNANSNLIVIILFFIFAEAQSWLGRRSKRAGMLPTDRAVAVENSRSDHEKPHQNVEEYDVS